MCDVVPPGPAKALLHKGSDAKARVMMAATVVASPGPARLASTRAILHLPPKPSRDLSAHRSRSAAPGHRWPEARGDGTGSPSPTPRAAPSREGASALGSVVEQR